MGFVFISYSRKDRKKVDNIVSKLQEDGLEIWIDRESIKGGKLWTVEIVEAIDTADSFVLMLSPHATQSDNVRKEVHLAQDAKRSLFPLVLAAVNLPSQFRYQLAGIQFIDYVGNPTKKYLELVEVLKAKRDELSKAARRKTRQVEVVLGREKPARFGQKKRENLLHVVARKSKTSRSNVRLTNLQRGSVHAFIEMPAHAAYVLKTAALNQDPELLREGIDAIRLDGEENFVMVRSGEIGPLDLPRQGPPFTNVLLLSMIGIAVIAAILFTFYSSKRPSMQSSAPIKIEPSIHTQVSEVSPPRRFTPTPTQTKTLTPEVRSFHPTSTSTPTETLMPNIPPAVPETISPKPEAVLPCNTPISLTWREPYDTDGIEGYEVKLDVTINDQWENIFILQVNGNTTQLDITKEASQYCGYWLGYRVRAKDKLGAWSDWSPSPQFRTENPPPPATTIYVSPTPLNGIVECKSAPKLYWDEPPDSNGIGNYQLVINYYDTSTSQWENAVNTFTQSTSYDISDIAEKFCKFTMSTQVIAQDSLGAWGAWSPWLQFTLDETPP